MKMSKRGLLARTAVGAVGSMMLVGVAGAALADPLEGDEVDVNVVIPAIEPVGALTLSVAEASTTLTEGEAEADGTRVFNGTLPHVTVSDDRSDVAPEMYWYVTGQSSAFTSGDGASIGADKLGWRPAIVSGDQEKVAAGDEVVTSEDEPTQGSGESGNNVGLVGEELLAIAPNFEGEHTPGTWTASAALFLKTPADVTPGSYSSTLTLTLWEESSAAE